jgi:heat shock protein HslJ
MRTRIVLPVLTVMIALVLSACAPASAPTVSLDGTSWVLVSLNGQPALPAPQVTLNFTKNKIAGSDGCNQYSSSYIVKGNSIRIDKNIVSTMMACPDPIMQQASAYTTVLTQAATYKVDGGKLTLSDSSGKALATFNQQNTDLAGTSWTVTGYNNGKQAVVSVLGGTSLTAEFNSDGKLIGSAGCNNYNATYETTGKNIKIGPVASTKKMCNDPTGVMDQENQFLTALGTATTYTTDGGKLELRTADGALAVSFIKPVAPAASASAQTSQSNDAFTQALSNTEYTVEGTTTGKALLKDGVFEEQAAPDSATKIGVQLGKAMAFGDLNGDGTTDAAVTLMVEPGGSGTFYYLVPVINEQGTPKPGTAVLLGDRIIINSVIIQNSEVVVTMLTRQADEPMSAKPSVEVTQTFKLEGDQLVEVK